MSIVDSIKTCTKGLNNLSNDISTALKNKLIASHGANSIQINKSLSLIESKFYSNIIKLNELTNSNVNEDNIMSSVLIMYKQLSVTLKMFIYDVIPVIEKHDLTNVISSKYNNLPTIIVQLLDNLTRAIKSGVKDVDKECGAIEYRLGSKEDAIGAIDDKVKNSGAKITNEGAVEAISDTLSTVIRNTLNMIAIRSNSVNNTLDSVNGNIHNLNHQIVTSFGNGNRNITWDNFRDFFTSDSFVSSITGLAASVAIFLLMKKLVRGILTRIRSLFN